MRKRVGHLEKELETPQQRLNRLDNDIEEWHDRREAFEDQRIALLELLHFKKIAVVGKPPPQKPPSLTIIVAAPPHVQEQIDTYSTTKLSFEIRR